MVEVELHAICELTIELQTGIDTLPVTFQPQLLSVELQLSGNTPPQGDVFGTQFPRGLADIEVGLRNSDTVVFHLKLQVTMRSHLVISPFEPDRGGLAATVDSGS